MQILDSHIPVPLSFRAGVPKLRNSEDRTVSFLFAGLSFFLMTCVDQCRVGFGLLRWLQRHKLCAYKDEN